MSPLDEELMSLVLEDSPTGRVDYWKIANSQKNLDDIPQDPKNPLNRAKVELGKLLFYETAMAIKPVHAQNKGTYSCSTCHIPNAGFKAGRIQGIADGGIGFGVNGESRRKMSNYAETEMDVQGIRPLSVVNVAYAAENTLWNGSFGYSGPNEGTEHRWTESVDEGLSNNKLGFQGLEAQNIQGIKTHRLSITKDMIESMGYKSMFDEAFPEMTEDERYSDFAMSLALSAYLRSLTADGAPFQQWLKGDRNALTESQKRGAIVMFGKGNCTQCHSSPGLNATKFFALGLNDLDRHATFNEGSLTKKKNFGRGGFTGKVNDLYKFKVPTLYNLKGSSFFFHGSSARSLEEVVEYKNAAKPENTNVHPDLIAADFKPLNLSAEEKKDLVEFLENGLYDDTIFKHVPQFVMSGNCFPNNDRLSQKEICGNE